jgi:hypothetical protein
MNIETVRTYFTDLLNDHFSVQSVKSYIVNPAKLRNQGARGLDIIAIEFIINRTIRLHIFGIEQDGQFVFTRPKEGIADYIIAELRPHDFYFKLNDRISSHHNLIARVIDTALGFEAAELIKSTLSFYCSESGNNLDYCYGYKVLYNYRDTKTYDADFEVLISKGGIQHPYRGSILNGLIHKVTDENGNEVKMDKLFEV